MKPFLSLKKAFVCSMGVALLGLAQTAHADAVYDVFLDVSSLLGSAAGPFSLDFQLNAGSGAAVNTITLYDFSFTSGGAIGSPTVYSGSPTGSLSGSIVMTGSSTTNPFTEIAQQFSAGTTGIHFKVDSTTNLTGTTPAAFIVSLDDNSTFQIPTTAPDGVSLVLENIGSSAASTLAGIQVFQSSGTGPAGFDTSGVTASAPESGPGLWMLSALAAVGLLVSRRPRFLKA